jgi:hypothetical protein
VKARSGYRRDKKRDDTRGDEQRSAPYGAETSVT